MNEKDDRGLAVNAISKIVKRLLPEEEWGPKKVREVVLAVVASMVITYLASSNLIKNCPKLEITEKGE